MFRMYQLFNFFIILYKMTTYYLNDPSSSWNVRTNIVQGLYEVPLNLYVNNPSTLTIKNTNIVDSLIYSDAMFSSSLGSLNINSNSLGTSIQCYNDIINIRTTPSANILLIPSTFCIIILSPLTKI